MQHPLEIILTRQWASHLQHPVWVMNLSGNLIYYNEAAEKLLGLRHHCNGEISAQELTSTFKHKSVDGKPISIEELPVTIALKKGRPAHLKMILQTLDGIEKFIESTSFPLVGQGGRQLGAISIFWEIEHS